jgi:hypothetical protein
VDELLGRVVTNGSPADLVPDFTSEVPSVVLGRLLGIAWILDDQPLHGELVKHPERVPAAVEELLRLTSVARHGPRRVAKSGVQVGDQFVPTGTGVVVSLHAANPGRA